MLAVDCFVLASACPVQCELLEFVKHSLMSRCAEESVFNRVLCVTLLAIAVTFTVILTNVFVDIDSLLMGKSRDASTATEQDTPSTSETLIKVEDTDGKDLIFDDDRFELFGTDEARNDLTDDAKIEDEQTARTKRSLDALNKNNPKIKKLLTRRLETLLEELDSDDALTTQTIPTVVTEGQALDHENNSLHSGNKDEDDLLRLAMHNILLDGVISHIDLSSIYAEVHNLVKCFNKIGQNSVNRKSNNDREHHFEEYDLLQEMAKCEDLRNHNTGFVETLKYTNVNEKTKKEPKKIIIKTTIDIAMDGVENRTISGNDVKSEVQIKFNGELLNSRNGKQDVNITLDENMANSTNSGRRSNRIYDDTNVSSNFLFPFVRQYLKKYSNNDVSASSNFSEKILNNNQSKRLKRQIKLRFNEKKEEEDKTHTLKSHEKKAHKDEAEVFVEIKTHFNKKGIKGAKKNKLIKALIKKIEKAIHADLEQSAQSKKSVIVKHWNIKKRTQDPLEKITPNTHAISLDEILSSNSIGKREVNPITKEVNRNVAEISDYKGNPWRKQFRGPGFLTASKSINSAETGKVDIDYNKVLSVNGIPKRLQQPLTTDDDDNYEEITGPEAYTQLTRGIQNYRFLIKNNDGTGLSIGLNQYTDGLPEPDALKMFSSLESQINAFQLNDKLTGDTNTNAYGNSKADCYEKTHSVSKRDVSGEIEHANTYGQDIIKNSALIYQNYQEILDHRMKVSKESRIQNTSRSDKYSLKSKQYKRPKEPQVQLPVLLDDQILQQELNPSEILDIANLLDRKRRHVKMNKITNLKTNKNRRNTYLNTKSLKRMIIYKNKRNKRQIRFISNRKDDDNVFGSSEENIFSDRAVLNEATEENNDAIDTAMMKVDYNYLKMADLPQLYNRQRIPDYFIRARAQTNKETSHYPHIFLSEQVKDDKNPEYFEVSQPDVRTVENNEETKENGDTGNVTLKKEEKLQDFEELVQSIMPSNSKRKYKVIVKLKPKSTINGTEIAGFKEVHTSFNKSFNKDGMKYFTLVNVSQISKIEKINITKSTPSSNQSQLELNDRRQMEKEHDTMKTLLQYQKEAINTQLRNLQNENSRIDSIIARNFKTRRAINANLQMLQTNEVKTTTAEVTARREVAVDIITTTEVPRLRLYAEDVNNIIKIAITKFQQSPIIAELTRRAEKPVIIEPTTTTTTKSTTTTTSSTTTTTTTKPDVLTNIILANINLTAQVLKKIDENTDILAKFLKKIHSRNDNSKMRDYPTRRVSKLVNTHIKAPCSHHKSECTHTSDPIIDKRSIISDFTTNKNTVLQPFSTGNDLLSNNQIDSLTSRDNKINVKEKEPNNKFFMDANRSTETGKVLSIANLNNTNPVFQQL